MLAVVKRPRTDKNAFEVRGDIPSFVLDYLKSRFGNRLTLIDDDELLDITQTAWYKRQQSRTTPGKTVRIYRQRDHLTQAELGQKLGGLSIQKISDLENDRRGISKDLVKKLAQIFNTPADMFL